MIRTFAAPMPRPPGEGVSSAQHSRRLDAVALRQVAWFLGVLAAATACAMVPLWVAGADAEAFNSVVPLLSWAPTVAALVAYLLTGRRSSFLRWTGIRPAISWRIAGTWAVVLGVFLLIPLASTALGVAAGVVAWQPTAEAWSLAPLIVPFALVALLTVTGEEIGWRGALQTTLAPLGPWCASILVAALWSLWHLPLTLGYASTGDLAPRDVAATSVDLLIAGVLLSAARIHSSSMWPAAWAHALLNSTLVFAESNLVTPTRSLTDNQFWAFQTIVWIVVAAAAIVAMVLARRSTRQDANLLGQGK